MTLPAKRMDQIHAIRPVDDEDDCEYQHGRLPTDLAADAEEEPGSRRSNQVIREREQIVGLPEFSEAGPLLHRRQGCERNRVHDKESAGAQRDSDETRLKLAGP